jgi:hypothetical protein
MRRVLGKFFIILLGSFGLTAVLFLSCPAYSKPIETMEINVWNKVSTDELNPGLIVPLDMSKGYSVCEGPLIFIVVRIVGSEEEVVLAFPNKGYWTAPKADPFLHELQKEFDNLEEYLRNKGGTEWKKD